MNKMIELINQTKEAYEKAVVDYEANGPSQQNRQSVNEMNDICIGIMRGFFEDKDCVESVSILSEGVDETKWRAISFIDQFTHYLCDSSLVLSEMFEDDAGAPSEKSRTRLIQGSDSLFDFVHYEEKLQKEPSMDPKVFWRENSSREKTILCLHWYDQALKALSEYLELVLNSVNFIVFLDKYSMADRAIIAQDLGETFHILSSVSLYFLPFCSSEWQKEIV